ncbi:MAG: O-antigen ligase family protein [Acidimicrobiia bacterium]|nr:O-antigen ligase family protein [Acidimicrobiia bacterium]
MTTTSDSNLRRAGFILVVIALAATQVKLQIAQWALWMAAVLWVVVNTRERRWREGPAFLLPLLAYAGWTLVSAAASVDPAASIIDSKQLFLLLMVPVVATFARGTKATHAIDVIIAVGSASALYGIAQFNLFGFDSEANRPVGPLDHWMTYSGVLMLATGAAVARLLYVSRDWVWPAIAVPALVVALFYTLTRNAMVGLAASVSVLLTERNWRLLLALPVLGVILLVAAPQVVTSRIQSIGDLTDLTTRDRVAMLRSGVHMVQDNPLTGVGPDMVKVVYPHYRDATYAVNDVNPHLHNVPMQIAAERGLPALAIWLWFVVIASRDLWRQIKRSEGYTRAAAGAGVAAMVAMLVAGLFEYNFGDSEFLMLFLGLITLPWAAQQPDAPGGTHV